MQRYVMMFLWMLIAASRSTAGAQIIGIEFGGTIRVIDPLNGASGVIAQSGYFQANSMAQDSTGKLFFFAGLSPNPTPRLVEFRLDTLTTFDHGPQLLNDVRAIAFAPGNDTLLYVITPDPISIQNRLYALPVPPGGGPQSPQLIGNTSLSGIQGMVFSPSGVLYGWSTGFGLVTIDTQTAGTIDVNNLTDGTSEIQTLCFGPNGVLYGLYNNLYTIDPTTGAKSLVAAGVFPGGIRGAEFVLGATDPRTYCVANPNSTGLPSRIGWTGSTGVTQNQFGLTVDQLPAKTRGIFLAGRLRANLPFGDGRLCIGGQLSRLTIVGSSTTGFAQSPINLLVPPIRAGERWNFQFWYRDLTALGPTSNTSDALEALFAP